MFGHRKWGEWHTKFKVKSSAAMTLQVSWLVFCSTATMFVVLIFDEHTK